MTRSMARGVGITSSRQSHTKGPIHGTTVCGSIELSNVDLELECSDVTTGWAAQCWCAVGLGPDCWYTGWAATWTVVHLGSTRVMGSGLLQCSGNTRAEMCSAGQQYTRVGTPVRITRARECGPAVRFGEHCSEAGWCYSLATQRMARGHVGGSCGAARDASAGLADPALQ